MRPTVESGAAAVGVLLTNLGTPDTPTTKAVRRYLAEFLSDPRVIEAPRWIWWLILHGVILRLRPRRSARLYRNVWSEDGSPLLTFSRRQQRALQASLEPHFRQGVKVVLGMRYGNPSIASALGDLAAHGVQRLLVLPAYPQYSATTVASTFDAVGAALARERVLPELRFVTGYHLEPGYISALADSVRDARATGESARAAKLLFSFHGLPKRYVDAGDPYRRQCEQTATAVAAALGLDPGEWGFAFQSRVGREEWLRPYTDELLEHWARTRITAVDVLCPGFSADCLETIDEIDREARATFLEHGGQQFRYIPALNDAPSHIEALATLVLTRTVDWQSRPVAPA